MTVGRLGRLIAASALAASSAIVGCLVSPASAAGSAGYCEDDTGVTVVVDFSALGGDIVVRCAEGPRGSGDTGLDALADAGFTTTGTQRWGNAFVCRISGQPSAHESLGDDGYREQCIDTPPVNAFWGYWSAPNDGGWTFNHSGASTHKPIVGGFEGWSFSLDHEQSDAPAPGVDPSRPDAPPTKPSSTPSSSHPTSSHPTTPPPATDPPTSTPTSTGTGTTQGGSHPSSKPHRSHPTSTVAPPTATSGPTAPATTSDSTAPVVTGELPDDPDDSAGSSTPLVIGVALVALLGVGAGVTAWRRSH